MCSQSLTAKLWMHSRLFELQDKGGGDQMEVR